MQLLKDSWIYQTLVVILIFEHPCFDSLNVHKNVFSLSCCYIVPVPLKKTIKFTTFVVFFLSAINRQPLPKNFQKGNTSNGLMPEHHIKRKSCNPLDAKTKYEELKTNNPQKNLWY